MHAYVISFLNEKTSPHSISNLQADAAPAANVAAGFEVFVDVIIDWFTTGGAHGGVLYP